MAQGKGSKAPQKEAARPRSTAPSSQPGAERSSLGPRSRHIWFALIVLVAVVLDQGSKLWADRWLASPKVQADFPAHPVVIVVEGEDEGQDLQTILTDRLSWSTPGQIAEIMQKHLRVDGLAPPHEPTMRPGRGQKLTILEREVVIIQDFWHHRFVRNPGAAWGLFRGVDASIRRPMFVVVTLISIGLILVIYLRARRDQRLLGVSLALILGGAVGNLIDRVRLGWVIDFIEWFIVVDRDHLGWLAGVLGKFLQLGRAYHWPTFNIADAAITVGVGLLLIEVLRGQPAEKEEQPPAGPPAS